MNLTKSSTDSTLLTRDRLLERKQVIVDDKKSYLMAKRVVDIVMAILAIILVSPIFLLVALCIKLEDPKGPVFFKQTRVGLNGKQFSMYKFRSMVHNAEELLGSLLHQNEVAGAMFKMKQDPRVTRVGRIIRKTSIDEFPQFFNVLFGDMSLVGPRPPLPREVELYTEYDKNRLLVQPGCTGLWQVSGRSSMSFEEMVELDLRYIRERSLLLDASIMVRTFSVLLNDKNAY